MRKVKAEPALIRNIGTYDLIGDYNVTAVEVNVIPIRQRTNLPLGR